MALPIYASTGQKIWHYTYRTICVLVFLFLIIPILVIIPLSFNAQDFFTFTPEMLAFKAEGYSLKHYEDFFTNSDWQGALANSAGIAPMATILSVSLRHAGGHRAQPVPCAVPSRDHGDPDLADDRAADHFGGGHVLLLLPRRPAGHLLGRRSGPRGAGHPLRDHHGDGDADRFRQVADAARRPTWGRGRCGPSSRSRCR